ncbi:unnamed protein product [Rotaria sp. Silwood2]|nr:unnamed protein product [Rotaria sp. Silwood2]CAF2747583.1 unnamed protein product [Rotaria sp. Silwood2]CAF3259796.1 unnamed protein product [Rotaria sp. Silwood2]CAF4190415.1 unnamed protein product [Rotaria sp. Silwood2]CAF4215842.1 unnamed protein product [Rotaria sp. Silwood2]
MLVVKKLNTDLSECQICGVPASHVHFGVLSCASCKIFFKRNAEFEQLTTWNLLQSDKSLLNSNQWTLLSNLIHSYDASKLLAIAQRLMNENNILQSVEMSNPILMEEFVKGAYETSGTYLRSNRDLLILSSENRSEFLRGAAEHVHCLSSIFVLNQSQLYIHQPFLNACRRLYGEQSVGMAHHVMKHIDPDVVLVKLALSLFAFSFSVLIFSPYVTMQQNNSSLIFHIQNTYAEVTWKYLIYKYGYYQAIIRFTNIIQCLLAATDTVSRSQNIEIHTNTMESLVEQTEISFILEDTESIDSNST